MRRFFTICLLVTSLLSLSAPAHAYENSYSKWAKTECRMSRNGNWSQSEIRDLIRCSFIRIGDRGHIPIAMYIVDRESGFNPHADNPSSTAGGLYQWLEGSWPAAQFPAIMNKYGLVDNRYHARSAAFISAVRISRHGCSPWFLSC